MTKLLMLAITFAISSGFCAGVRSVVGLAGNTFDCLGNRRLHPQGIDIYVFDSSKSLDLVSWLKTEESSAAPDARDNKAVQESVAHYDQLTRLVKTTPHIAHTRSGNGGSFKLEIPAGSGAIIVLGYAESVDGPAGYAISRVDVRDTSVAGLVLDFTHGHCIP